MQQPPEINVIVLMVLAACAFIATVIKLLVMPTARNMRSMLAAFVIAVPIAVLGGYIAFEMGWNNGAQWAVTAIVAFTAERLVLALIDSSKSFPDLVKLALTNLVNKWTK